jgi:hypothetical protein
MNDYTKLDAALLERIAAGCNTMMLLDGAKELLPLIEPFRTKDRWGGLTPEFRIVDRRLQALRKQGKIRFNNKTWERV